MRYRFALLTLFLAVPVHAGPPPEGAYERALSPEDHGRLMRMIFNHARTHPRGNQELLREQSELSKQLLAELYSPSPDLAAVERLDARMREFKHQILQTMERSNDEFYRTLSPEDRLKIMKMNYALPPRITVVPPGPASSSR